VQAADWTTAVDDGLRGQPTSCTVCGQPGTAAYFDIWQASSGVVVAVARCQRCFQHPGSTQAVEALLERRYASEPRGRDRAS